MIRAANHSSYPWFGMNPPDEELREAMERHAAGRLGDRELRDLQDQMTTIVVAEQSRAFIDIVTDGMVCWRDAISVVVEGLEGMEPAEAKESPGGGSVKAPVVSGRVRRHAPLLLHTWEVGADVAQKPLKVVLPGPVLLARLADAPGVELDVLVDQLAAVYAEETAELAEAGATHFQLDEPTLGGVPEDLERITRSASRIFAAAPENAVTHVSTYGGDLTSVGARIAEIPGSHVALDLTRASHFDLLSAIPDGRGLVLGIFDARSTEIEDAEDVAARLEPHRSALEGRDLIVGPNAGLGTLSRDDAFDKLLQARYLVEKLQKDWGQ